VSLAAVHYRGGKTEFELGRHYGASSDPLDRVTGADVLAQLGWGEATFQSESVEILISLLKDADERVISAAAVGLGHRKDPAAIRHVLALVDHPNPDIQLGVVHALSRHDIPAAIAGLIHLARDLHEDVRNWAAFGLGSMTEVDTPELSDALAGLLDDPNAEIRGEAMTGLARRQDARTLASIVRELAGEFHGSWCLEAAELLADVRLVPLLRKARERLHEEDILRFAADFDRAELACSKARVSGQ